jgi:hypothetical protein
MPPERRKRISQLDPNFPYAIPNGVLKYQTDLDKESVIINWRAKNVQSLARGSRRGLISLKDCGIVFRTGSKVFKKQLLIARLSWQE